MTRMNPLKGPAVSGMLLLGIVACGDSARDTETRPNILLVTLDTVRADRLGCYGYEAANTPALDKLAARGVLFRQAFTPAPMTLTAHSTLMTGLLPPQHGARVNGVHRLSADVPTLAEELAATGYRTGAFVAAFVLDAKFGLDRGFERYEDELSGAHEQEVRSVLATYRSGDQVVDAALDWLAEEDAQRPFFAWVHLYDAHYPWFAHGDEGTESVPGSGTYDGEVAFVDAQFSRLTAWLEQRGLAENTLVLAVADHGEGLGDHHEIEHAYLLNEEVLHVPWIVAGPGVRAGHEVQALVSLADFRPTVLDLLELEASDSYGPSAGLPGRSLATALSGVEIESRVSYAETDLPWTSYRWAPQRSLTTEHWKYIRTPEAELYDRTVDRGELANLIEVRPGIRSALEAQLAELEHSLGDTRSEALTATGAELEHLSALGYTIGIDEERPDELEGLADVKARLVVKDLEAELRRRCADETIEPAEVARIAHELVRQSPETPAFHSTLGTALIELGRLEEGITALDHAVQLEPTSPTAHYELADALQRLGRNDQAGDHFELALELEPGMAAAHVGMGNVRRAEGRPDLAAGQYTEALRQRPGYPEAYYNLAQTFVDRGQLDLAVENMGLALQHWPDWVLAHRSLASLLFDSGRQAESLAHFEAALESDPRDAALLNELGVVLEGLGRTDEARDRYLAARDAAPEFFRPHVNLAKLAFAAGDDAPALAHYEEALRVAPGLTEPTARLARFLATCPVESYRDSERAIALAERAVDLSGGGSARALDTLASAYASAARYGDAVTAAQRAQKLAGVELAADIQARLALYALNEPFVVLRETTPDSEGVKKIAGRTAPPR